MGFIKRYFKYMTWLPPNTIKQWDSRSWRCPMTTYGQPWQVCHWCWKIQPFSYRLNAIMWGLRRLLFWHSKRKFGWRARQRKKVELASGRRRDSPWKALCWILNPTSTRLRLLIQVIACLIISNQGHRIRGNRMLSVIFSTPERIRPHHSWANDAC